MKVIEEWEDGECKVTIKAEFVTNGVDIGNYFSILTDVVNIVAELTWKDESWLAITRKAHKESFYEKRFLRTNKYFTLEENYNLVLEELREDVKKKIAKKKNDLIVRVTDQQITDGLPDSLKGM